MTLGQIAYEGYLESSGGVSLISGIKLPDFSELKDDIKKAWENAAEAVKDEVVSQIT